MTLILEAQDALRGRRKEAQHARRNKQKRRKPIQPKTSSLDAPLATAHPHQVLTLFEWAQLNRISVRTARRIIARGEVVVTQLSAKRIGITIGNNAAWQQSRARG